MNQEKLQLRKKIKAKKPTFVSQDTHKKIRIRKRWRKPRGWQSKIRLKRRGYRKMVMTGYGSPKSVYGVHSTGLEIVRVNSEPELKDIDSKSQGIIIAKTGTKNKVALVKKAKEMGITILNVKNVDEYIKLIEEKTAKKKQEKQKKADKEKKQVKKKEEKKAKEKPEEKISEDEKKELEKKKAEKIITKKN